MFTGLIQDVGTIEGIKNISSGIEFQIKTSLASQIKVDDSVATNGVCLTATKVLKDAFLCQAVPTTLEKTTLSHLRIGHKVNLELAMQLSDRLGGHLVQGHVSGLGQITSITTQGETWKMTIQFPPEFSRYMIAEGSVALDGVSLTIAALSQNHLTVALIPHTLNKTALREKRVGDRVNIEVDMMAKYVEKLLNFQKVTPPISSSIHYED